MRKKFVGKTGLLKALILSFAFFASFYARPSDAQVRGIGAGSLILDDGTGHTVTLFAPTITGSYQLKLPPALGAPGQTLVIQSDGSLQWQTGSGGVGSFSGGSTGLTPSTPMTGAVTLGGILGVANGGTGNSTGAATSFTGSLAGDVTGTQSATTVAKINGNPLGATTETLGNYLRSNGASWLSSGIQAGDVPTLNQNTTGNAATVTTDANLTGPVTSTGNATSIAANALSESMVSGLAASLTSATTNAESFFTAGTGISLTTGVIANTGVLSIDGHTGAYTLASADIPNNAANTTGNAATVTTDANLTGPVTSTGNATSIAANALSESMVSGLAASLTSATTNAESFFTAGTGISLTTGVIANTGVLSIDGHTGAYTLASADIPNNAANTTGNAATVTTDANLTGPVTSTGNATSIAANALSESMVSGLAASLTSATTNAESFFTAGTGISLTTGVIANTGVLSIDGHTGAYTLASADIPNNAANTTGNAATVTTDADLTGPVTSSGNATTISPQAVGYSNIVNEASVSLLGNPTGASTTTEAITLGSGLSFSGTTLIATGSGGTVTSVSGAGGGTGLTLTGGPITTTGTLTLGGVLDIANGGTNSSTTLTNGKVMISNTGSIVEGPVWTSGTSTLTGNITGNAATVTTDANLTGPVTSTGNATSIAANALSESMVSGLAASLTSATTNAESFFTAGTGISLTTGVIANTGVLSIDGHTGAYTLASADIPNNAANTTGNAATVTTDANLTGPVTSTGNATSIAANALSESMVSGLAASLTSATTNAESFFTAGTGISLTTGVIANTGVLSIDGHTGAYTLASADIPNNAANTTGNAATVTTDANLTGPVTSTGNATSIAANALSESMVSGLAASLTSATTNAESFFTAGTGISLTTGVIANTGVLSIDGHTGAYTLASADIPNNAANTTGNAATVTTDANLTGPVTSTGNATSIAANALSESMVSGLAASLTSATTNAESFFTAGTGISLTTGVIANTGVLSIDGHTGAYTLASADIPNNAANTTGNAATVTTDANLTGPVTSTGNATSIAANALSESMVSGLAASLTSATTNAESFFTAGTGISLTTGVIANTGVLSIDGHTGAYTLVSADIPNNAANTTGNAATATTAVSFSGSLVGDVTGTQGATTISTTAGPNIVTAINDGTGAIDAANGGTGDASFTVFAPIVGGATSTGALQSASTGMSNSGWVLTSNGSSSVPTWQASSAGNAVIYSPTTSQATAASGDDLFDVEYAPGGVASALGAVINSIGTSGTATGLTVTARGGTTSNTGIVDIFEDSSASSNPSYGMTINGTGGAIAGNGSVGLFVGKTHAPDIGAELKGTTADMVLEGSYTAANATALEFAGNGSDPTDAALAVNPGDYPNAMFASGASSGIYAITTASTSTSITTANFGTFNNGFGLCGAATATPGTPARIVGVWGLASGVSQTNTSSIGVLAQGQGQGETYEGSTNVALEVSQGELTMGRTTDPNTHDGTGVSISGSSASDGPSGLVALTTSFTSVAGPAIREQSFNVGNEYCASNSVILATVQNNPDATKSTYTVQVVPASGQFTLILTQNVLSSATSTVNPHVNVGYIIINPSR